MTVPSDIQSLAGPPSGAAPRRWAAVLLLMVVGILNIMDRFLPSILAQPIKSELMLSDTALGLINGFGFLVVYAVIGLPIARMSDRGRYGVVITACVALWSAMTMLGGLAQAGWQLALSRMGVAVGEAGSTPAAHAYISRNFAPDRRAAPLAVLTLSVPLANVIGLAGGGLLGEAIGWRMTFVVMGVLGLVLAPLIYRVLGGHKLVAADAAAASVTHSPKASIGAVGILLAKRSYLLILAACTCIAIGGYSLTVFAPAFLMRTHGLALGEVGLEYGPASGLAGIVALLLTGWLADRLSGRDPRWLLWVISLMVLILLPFAVMGFMVPGRWMAVGFIALASTIATAYLVPTVAAMQRLAPPHLRATASALMLFCSALIGGTGPLVTGMISDHLAPAFGAGALGHALLIVPVMYGLAALLFLAASLTFRADMIADETGSGAG